ncbi:hypothetical protein KGA66_17345 [Actinocrinis puniceicyclus]|uniref:Uncharacterized protein n=1 Tax=Actinocrinis puniceicyclus TaxID=977794 RepID=A0A8J7WLY2_9ACTN|nr:hypothetical protein [Actinocrinis puniceicyclus]MBS2964826.1 hypothetical protein [Actinocrinis puniceicyclus]
MKTMHDTPPQAWTEAETQIRRGYTARLANLLRHPQARAVLTAAGLGQLCAPETADARLSDLAVALYRLENALSEDRAALPPLSLMEPDDVERHPGFDGVEVDALAEEEHLLELREALRGA